MRGRCRRRAIFNARSELFGRAYRAKTVRLGSLIPNSSTTIDRTSRICRGNGIPAGQTVSQALQDKQRLWGPAAASSP
jgi:hypothetical protein